MQQVGILERVEALDDGRGTENGAGDTVVAGPTSVAALNFAIRRCIFSSQLFQASPPVMTKDSLVMR